MQKNNNESDNFSLDFLNGNYEQVIKYYRQQKQDFLDICNKALKDEQKKLTEDEILKSFWGEDKNNDENAFEITKEAFENALNQVYEEINNSIQLGGSISASLKNSAENFDKVSGVHNKKYYDEREKFLRELEKLIGVYYSQSFIEDNIKRALNNKQIVKTDGYDFSTLKNSLYTVFTAVLRESIIKNNYSIYKNYSTKEKSYNSRGLMPAKGYIAEAMLYDSISIFFEDLANKVSKNDDNWVSIEHSGKTNVASGEDIKIKFIQNGKTFKLSKDINLEFGIQSKSYDLPSWGMTDIGGSGKGIKLSTNLNLYKKIFEDSDVITIKDMLYKISEENNLKTATDNSFIWRFGNTMIYTDALLQNAINNKRYVGFSPNTKDETLYLQKYAASRLNTLMSLN